MTNFYLYRNKYLLFSVSNDMLLCYLKSGSDMLDENKYYVLNHQWNRNELQNNSSTSNLSVVMSVIAIILLALFSICLFVLIMSIK